MITRHTKRQKYRKWRERVIIITILFFGAWLLSYMMSADIEAKNRGKKALIHKQEVVILEKDD